MKIKLYLLYIAAIVILIWIGFVIFYNWFSDNNALKNSAQNPTNVSMGELLYNGILLPETWPPRHFQPDSDEPMPVPYLDLPPKIIPVDLGRQLFIDDFLIEETDMQRTYYQAEKYSGNPVFVPESTDEINGPDGKKSVVYFPNGGIFYDYKEGIFKMFYSSGWLGALALATSRDMIHWERPDLGLSKNNIFLPKGHVYTGEDLQTAGSNNSIWLDLEADESERIKYLTCWIHAPEDQRPKHTSHTMHTSDGENWSKASPTGIAGDLCSFFYNPFRKVWVSSIRISDGPRGRCRYYSEHADFLSGADWSRKVYWTNADNFDAPEPFDGYHQYEDPPQLYSLNAVAYESIMVGMHYIWRGPVNKVIDEKKYPKITDLELGFSRDGFHWHRPDRRGFIRAERKEESWDRGYLRSPTGVFVVTKDKLIFPYTGFSGVANDGIEGPYSGASIGIAMLRRDGFASMDAGEKSSTLLTRPLIFSGKYLFVNTHVQGELRVEVRDLNGQVIQPFTLQNSLPIRNDRTSIQVNWKGIEDLSSISNKPVQLYFELYNGSLFSFWISKELSGSSQGFLAAGGLGYDGIRDTQGSRAIDH